MRKVFPLDIGKEVADHETLTKEGKRESVFESKDSVLRRKKEGSVFQAGGGEKKGCSYSIVKKPGPGEPDQLGKRKGNRGKVLLWQGGNLSCTHNSALAR